MEVFLWVLLFLAVLAGVLLLIRLNYRQHIFHGESCPKCGGNKFHRVRRHTFDRIFGMGLETRRFRCASPNCRWEGIRQYSPHPKSWGKSEHRSRHSQPENMPEK